MENDNVKIVYKENLKLTEMFSSNAAWQCGPNSDSLPHEPF